MKLVKTEDAVGHVLCHDITQIIKDEKKGPVFRKGHIIAPEDIPVLLSVGKEHLYIWENNEKMLHEDEAAEILRDLCMGENMHATEPKEGKMRMEKAKAVVGSEPLMRLLPLKSKKVGVVTTGSEVFYGRIRDTFTPVIEEKLHEFGGSVMTEHVILNDEHEKITAAILDMLAKGCDMVVCSGGMSVDPDDKTPLAIKNTGANIVSYGSPVLPGAMFLVSYMPDGRPVCGLPGCVMYARRTIFDLLLPYLVTDTPITKEHLAGLGHGGLCLNCPVCHFPNCGFGKGV